MCSVLVVSKGCPAIASVLLCRVNHRRQLPKLRLAALERDYEAFIGPDVLGCRTRIFTPKALTLFTTGPHLRTP